MPADPPADPRASAAPARDAVTRTPSGKGSADLFATSTAVLDDLGPFFSVEIVQESPPQAPLDGTADPTSAWQPLTALLTGATLAERVAYVQHFLADRSGAPVHPRVAASILSLGLFARLLSPYLGAATAGVPLPLPDVHAVRFRVAPSGPWPLGLTGPPRPADPAEALATLVQPLAARIGAEHSVSATILRGNAASSVFGAVGMIRASRPDLGRAALRIAGRLLAGPLAGTGTLGGQFVRSSCCLYYRVPGGGYCGDCVLVQPRR